MFDRAPRERHAPPRGGSRRAPSPHRAAARPGAASLLQRHLGNRRFQQVGSAPLVQRTCACGGTCARCAGHDDEALVQAKLTVGPPGDRYEREADRVADRAVRTSDAEVTEAAAPAIQRLGAAGPAGASADVALPTEAGRPLSAATRSFMEPRLGADFGGVRLHTGPAAERAAERLGARAFTHGRDVWLGRGEREGDRRLMAHELTHVVQQGGSHRAGAPGRDAVQRTLSFTDCSATQRPGLRTAVADARREAGRVRGLLAQRPLPEAVRDALWLAFRDDSEATADAVREAFAEVETGLADATLECEQPGSFLFDHFCGGAHAYVRSVPAFVGLGSIHLCMDSWDAETDAAKRSGLILHEATHRYAGTSDAGYFRFSDCDESAGTVSLGTSRRLDNADSYACLARNLLHISAATLSERRADYSGQSLTGIDQSQTGPIDLDGDEVRVPLFSMRKTGGFGAFITGMEYRWVISDADDNRYLMWGLGGSVFHYGDHPLAWIPARTRALLKRRGVRNATVRCRAKIPGPQRHTRLFTRDVEFTTSGG